MLLVVRAYNIIVCPARQISFDAQFFEEVINRRESACVGPQQPV